GGRATPEARTHVEREPVPVEPHRLGAREVGHAVAVLARPRGERVAIERRSIDEPHERRPRARFVCLADDRKSHVTSPRTCRACSWLRTRTGRARAATRRSAGTAAPRSAWWCRCAGTTIRSPRW